MLFGAAGCAPLGDGTCTTDSDCGGGSECARTEECVPAGSLLTIRVNWSIAGVTPSPSDPSACTGVHHLIVSLDDQDLADAISYEPVPCSPPQITFNRMPPRIDGVTVLAVDDNGQTVFADDALLSGAQDSQVTLDLR